MSAKCASRVQSAVASPHPAPGPAHPPPQLGAAPPTFGMRPGHRLGHPKPDSWATRVPAQPTLHRGFGRICASRPLKPVDSDSAERVNKNNTHSEPRMTPAPAKEPSSAQMGAGSAKGTGGRETRRTDWGAGESCDGRRSRRPGAEERRGGETRRGERGGRRETDLKSARSTRSCTKRSASGLRRGGTCWPPEGARVGEARGSFTNRDRNV